MPETSQPRRFGDYVVERELGRGGMGVVYAATHAELGKRVAIKVLLADVSRDAELIERFMNEARAASAIEHPSIVEIHTVGHEGDVVYIVMELLQGESLASRLKAKGAMSIADAIGLSRQVANALDAAHRVGIVHRDLKPDNVFLVPDEEVAGGERLKLLDFGIAKLVGDNSASVARTVTGAILGTPHYMSPEQCEGAREVDARSDLYSLGCMVFQMVTGRLPFMSAGIGGLIGMHLHVAPPTLSSIRPDIPPDLDALVGKLLAKAPEDRVQTASEVSAALRDLGARPSKSTLAPPNLPVVQTNMATVATMVAPTKALPKRSSKQLVVGGGVVIAGAIAGFALTRTDDEVEPPPPVTQVPAKQNLMPRADVPAAERKVPAALEVGRKSLQEGDLADAERQLKRLQQDSPADPAVLAFAEAVGKARAERVLQLMKRNVIAKRFDVVKEDRDRVAQLTTDRTLRAAADRMWTEVKADAIKAARDKVIAAVKLNDCKAARAAAKLGQELGENYDELMTECAQRVKHAEDEAVMLATLKQRIETSTFPQSIAMDCVTLVQKDIKSVPWTTCINAACSLDSIRGETMIMNAPFEIRNKYPHATCPGTKR